MRLCASPHEYHQHKTGVVPHPQRVISEARCHSRNCWHVLMWLSALVERLFSVTALFPPVAERGRRWWKGEKCDQIGEDVAFRVSSCSNVRIWLRFDIAVQFQLSQPCQKAKKSYSGGIFQTNANKVLLFSLWIFLKYTRNKMGLFYYTVYRIPVLQLSQSSGFQSKARLWGCFLKQHMICSRLMNV